MKQRFDKNWDDLARQLGYINRRDMLQDLYVKRNLSLSEIGDRIGSSGHAVRRQLNMLDIDRRPRGGGNNDSRQSKKLFWMDQRVLLTQPPDVAARLAQVSTSLMHKYRRTMLRGEGPWTSASCATPTNSNGMQP